MFVYYKKYLIIEFKLKGIVSDAMRGLFNKAIYDQDTNAKYAIYELQYQVEKLYIVNFVNNF